MDKKIDKYKKLIEVFMRAINNYMILEKRPQKYGTNELFHKLEIHTIYKIGETPGINVTELAKWHGISKSAVSQVVKKLERRKFIFRYKAPDNSKEVLFKLTRKGEKAFEGHIRYHEEIDAPLISKIQEMSEEKIQILEEIIEMLEMHTKRRLEKK